MDLTDAEAAAGLRIAVAILRDRQKYALATFVEHVAEDLEGDDGPATAGRGS